MQKNHVNCRQCTQNAGYFHSTYRKSTVCALCSFCPFEIENQHSECIFSSILNADFLQICVNGPKTALVKKSLPVHFVFLLREIITPPRKTTFFLALMIIKSTVALLALLDDLVAAKGSVALREAVGLPPLGDGVQDGGDVGLGAVGEFVVVVAVAGGGGGEHDVVSADATGSTFLWIIVLKKCCKY